MIIEFNFGMVIIGLVCFTIGFFGGGIAFAMLIYFPDFKRLFQSIQFIYKYKRQMEKENDGKD